MKAVILTLALVLTLSACQSNPWRTKNYYVTPSCDLGEFDVQNANYRSQSSALWDLMRDRLYRDTMQPASKEDKIQVAKYEYRLKALDKEVTAKYGAAVTSCRAYRSCMNGSLGDDAYTCEDRQGVMLQDKIAFMRLGGALDDMQSEIMRYEPVAPYDWEDKDHRDKRHKKDDPTVKKDDSCANVDSVFTVGCAEE